MSKTLLREHLAASNRMIKKLECFRGKKIVFNYSNSDWKTVPVTLGNKLYQLTELQEIELNIENNSIESLLNSTMAKFDHITKIMAKKQFNKIHQR